MIRVLQLLRLKIRVFVIEYVSISKKIYEVYKVYPKHLQELYLRYI